MKKTVLTLFSVLLIACLFIMNVYADSKPKVSVGNGSGSIGDTVTLSIDISNNTGMMDAFISVSGDSDKLKPVSITPTNVLGSYMENITDDNKCVVLWSNWSNVSGNGQIATVTFEIVGGYSGEKIPVKIDEFEYSLEDASETKYADTTDGYITVINGLTSDYTISYDANGGTGAPESQHFSKGSSVMMSKDYPKRDGYKFLGWADNALAKMPDYPFYTNVNQWKLVRYEFSKSQTLYAVWMNEEKDLVEYPATGGNIYFNKLNGEVVDCDDSVTGVNIPEYIGGVKVVGIHDKAFSGKTNLIRVTLPDTIENIGTNHSISLITYNGAFAECTNLKYINIPSSLKMIGINAFCGCKSLQSDINIPSGVVYIGQCAFADCESIKRVTDNAKVRYVAFWMFSGCTALTDVTLNDNIDYIGSNAFASCVNLKQIELPKRLKTIDDYAFYDTGLTSIKLPDSVDTIMYAAFSLTKSLYEITLPKSLGLESKIESSVSSKDTIITSDVREMFVYSYIKNVYVDSDNPYMTSIDGMLYTKDGKTLLFCPYGKTGNVVIPTGTEAINDDAIVSNGVNSSTITSITVPEGVKTIGSSYCLDSLKTVVLPKSLESLDENAFVNNNPYDKATSIDRSKINFYVYKGSYADSVVSTWNAASVNYISEDEGPIVNLNINCPSVVKEGDSFKIEIELNELVDFKKCTYDVSMSSNLSKRYIYFGNGNTAGSIDETSKLITVDGGIYSNSKSGSMIVIEAVAKSEGTAQINIKNAEFTDSAGKKLKVNITGGNITIVSKNYGLTVGGGVKDIIRGDADNDKMLTASDATNILQKVLDNDYELAIQGETENWMYYVNVDGDNILTAADAAYVLQKVLNNDFNFK